ncbi:MAG TPA: alpha/beta fold hydrolase [Acetobacteraceae bacterium]|nr:alpha/beta fold hydrolase [Acetobacteraceae bacterium]
MAMQARFDPAAEAGRIAFDRVGNGEPVLLISGFPQTRRSWNRLIPLLSSDYETIAADLPSFGDSSGSGDDGECGENLSRVRGAVRPAHSCRRA